MSRAPGFRGALWVAIAGSALQVGCINHYYGTAPLIPGCPPVGSTITTQVGTVCDVPSGRVVVSNPASGATVSSSVADSSTRSAAVVASGGPSRVVISQPASGPPSVGQVSGRIKWRKPDPESLPPMKAEGGLDESVIR
jgi:hypothetical protein